MQDSRNPIEISVVLAAPEGGSGLTRCLESLQAQFAHVSGEIVVVHGPTVASGSIGNSGKVRICWIPSPSHTEVPILWKAGIDASSGNTVVLLVESCVPNSDWLAQILNSRRTAATVVGGAIDLAPEAGVVDSAVYFCRYSRYMPPFTSHSVDDLPGTNCAYPHTALEGLQEEMAEGFWETFAHKKMMSRGVQLLCDPEFAVSYIGPTSAPSFLRARFAHGRKFAVRRIAGMGIAGRTVRALAFPLVTLLMLQRVVTRVWSRRRYRGRLLTSLPLLLLFFAAWCAGESLGYLLGTSRRTHDAADQPNRILPEAS